MLPTQLSRTDPAEYAIALVDEAPTQLIGPPPTPFYERRAVVLSLIAFVGPLGLVPLWMSRRFGSRSKTIITLLYVAGTILFPIALIWYWCDYAIHPLVDALGK